MIDGPNTCDANKDEWRHDETVEIRRWRIVTNPISKWWVGGVDLKARSDPVKGRGTDPNPRPDGEYLVNTKPMIIPCLGDLIH